MLNTPSIRIERRGALAVMSMVQAERGNPIDDQFTGDFKQAAAALWDAGTPAGGGWLRAVLLRGEGPNFSYGGDLKSFGPVRYELGPLVRRWTADLHMGLQRYWQLPVPVVAAVQGFAMGGGLAVAAGCDVVVAGQSARLGSAFAQLGFSCDSGSSIALSARMGLARARRFVLLAEMLDAAEAKQVGLVDKVVADDQVQADALALAERLAAGPTLAYGEVKRLFRQMGGNLLTAQLEDEALTLARVAASADASEGIGSMLERRKPVFKGC